MRSVPIDGATNPRRFQAPACLGTELWVCPVGAADCNATTPGADLLCANLPIYGAGVEKRFDEPGYHWLRHQFWTLDILTIFLSCSLYVSNLGRTRTGVWSQGGERTVAHVHRLGIPRIANALCIGGIPVSPLCPPPLPLLRLHRYVGIPPCLWGSAAEGLLPPPTFALDRKLHSIKRNNNTDYHYGVMGQWQMRGAWA